jgi:tripartite-type tricarboxylate transporter receptor subunit TctC
MPQGSRISRRTALTIAVGGLLAPHRTMAQSAVPADFPKRPMTLILPLAPGGPVDVLGRLLAQEFQARSGYPASVENRTGGAGNIGIDAVRRSTPDGTTLLVIPAGNLTINPTLMPDLTFDVERDFAPITILATIALAYLVCCSAISLAGRALYRRLAAPT